MDSIEQTFEEQERSSLKAQSYILSKGRFKSLAQANKWMDDNNVPRPKVDEKETSFRFRQFPPDRCQEGSHRTTSITDGVQIVGCRLKTEFREQVEPTGEHDHPHGPDGGEHDHPGLPPATGAHGHSGSDPSGAHKHRPGDPDEGAHNSEASDIGLHAHPKALALQEALVVFGEALAERLFPEMNLDLPGVIELIESRLGLKEEYDGRKGPSPKALKKGRKSLSPDERKKVMEAKAVWHHGPNGEATPAVWKAIVNDKIWYACNTHRAINVMPTIEGAIDRFHKFIKGTA